MSCGHDYLAEPLEHQLAFIHEWNVEQMRRYQAKGEEFAGKNASDRKSLSMPNSNSVGSARARKGLR